jgi:hypothetical protein
MRHRARAPALVGDVELLGHAEREGRHDVEHHRAGVVVVAQDDHVGVFAPLELLDPLVGVEHRLPVLVLVAPLVERRADRRDVAGGDARVIRATTSCPGSSVAFGRAPPARIIAAYSSGVMSVIELTAFWWSSRRCCDSLTRK